MPKWLDNVFVNEQGSVRCGWKIIGFILAFAILATLWSIGLRMFHVRMGMAVGVWTSAALGASASFLCLRAEGRTFSSIGFVPKKSWILECLAGTLAGILLILVTALLVRGMDGFHWERTSGVGARQLLITAWVFLGVGFNEEIIFRGYPFQRLVEAAHPWVAQLTFAGFFALVHWGNTGMHGATKAWATLNIGLAAILLGFCYLRTRSLALPIGLHLGWNWAQGSLLGFGVSGTTPIKGAWTPVFHGRPEWLTGGAFGLEASLPCAIVTAAAILALWRWKRTEISGASAGASTASAS